MFSLLRWLLILVVIVVAVGWYLGWFSVSKPQADPQGNKIDFNVSVDKPKVEADLQRAEKKINQEAKQFEDRTNAK